MTQKSAVYRKTAAGQEALAHRDPSLNLRLRSVLILVDGKRSMEELARLSAGGDVEGLLSQLASQGLVEPVGAAPAPSPAPADSPATPTAASTASAPAAAAAAPRAMTLQEAQRAAVRCLTDLLGPGAEDLCLRIEAARTPHDFLALTRRAETTLRNVGGPQMAATFLRSLEGYRPPA